MNRTPRDRLTGFLLENATAIIFIVVFVYFGMSAANFFSAENTLNIIKQASFVGVIAVGMTFVLLTGGIDLSVGSNMYVSAMTVGYLLRLPGVPGRLRRLRRHRRRARRPARRSARSTRSASSSCASRRSS